MSLIRRLNGSRVGMASLALGIGLALMAPAVVEARPPVHKSERRAQVEEVSRQHMQNWRNGQRNRQGPQHMQLFMKPGYFEKEVEINGTAYNIGMIRTPEGRMVNYAIASGNTELSDELRESRALVRQYDLDEFPGALQERLVNRATRMVEFGGSMVRGTMQGRREMRGPQRWNSGYGPNLGGQEQEYRGHQRGQGDGRGDGRGPDMRGQRPGRMSRGDLEGRLNQGFGREGMEEFRDTMKAWREYSDDLRAEPALRKWRENMGEWRSDLRDYMNELTPRSVFQTLEDGSMYLSITRLDPQQMREKAKDYITNHPAPKMPTPPGN